MRPIVIASNRGPISFSFGDGDELLPKRGAGGLISGIGPLVKDTDTIWMATALSDADRVAAADGVIDAAGFRVRTLAIDEDVLAAAYDRIGNSTLWFLHHAMFDVVRQPAFDRTWQDAWGAYRRFNQTFADAIADEAPVDAVVLVQDFHLALVASCLGDRRPDLDLVHFSHTPFAPPHLIHVLPDDARVELLEGMAAFRACGFHTERWAADFRACCTLVLGEVGEVFVAPLGTDVDDITAAAATAECGAALDRLNDAVGTRQLIARVDRIELSKNIVRGFLAYELLLEEHPELHGEVVFGASIYPSRLGVPEYRVYAEDIEATVERINERFATSDWTPILLDTDDDFLASVAVLRRYDALLVNPIRDGLNLVAKEGTLVNERSGSVLLSPETGAFAELEHHVLAVHPYDLAQTAEQLHRAVSMSESERSGRHVALLDVVGRRTPRDWLVDQLAAADETLE